MAEHFRDWLVDYLAGELAPADEEAFEHELFTLDDIAGEVAAVLGLQDGIAAIARFSGGGLTPIMDAEQVAALKGLGLAVLELSMDADDDLVTPIPAEVEFLIAHLQLPPGTRGQLDFQIVSRDQAPEAVRLQITDAPWDPESGRLSVVCHRHMAMRDRVSCFRVIHAETSTPVAEYIVRLP